MDVPVLKYKVRPESIDWGKEYEVKVIALLCLRCIDSKIQNFWIASNTYGAGALDDVVLRLRTTENETVSYMVQLKHQIKAKPLQEENFRSETGGFSLSKYFNDIDAMRMAVNSQVENETIIASLDEFDKIIFVLFTNRGLNHRTFFKTCCSSTLSYLQTDKDKSNLFRFDVNGFPGVNEDYNLYLLSNQVNATHIDEELVNELKRVAHELNITSKVFKIELETFSKFVSDWSKGRLGGHYALTKEHISSKLFELLINQYEVDLMQQPFANAPIIEESVWSTLVNQHKITIVDATNSVCSLVTANLRRELTRFCNAPLDRSSLNDTLSTEEQSSFYQDHMHLKGTMLRIVGNYGKITYLDIYKCMWLTGECPLLLEVNDRKRYRNIINISKLSNLHCRIIIFNKSNEDLINHSDDANIFSSLKDLNGNSRTTILQHLVKLQGRSSVKLETLLHKDLFKYVKCSDIINILNNTFNIGDALKSLPPYFIPRSVAKIFLNIEVLRAVQDEMFLLSNYCKGSHIVPVVEGVYYFKGKYVDLRKLKNSRIIIVPKEVDLELNERLQFADRVVHHLSFYSNDLLQWRWSSGSTNNISSFRVHVEGEFEDNFNRYFDNSVNIISEIPGMGKSVLLDYLALHAPASKWVLRIDLNKHHKYYSQEKLKQAKTAGSQHLDYFYNYLLEQPASKLNLGTKVFQQLLKSKDVIVFLDGCDEVSTKEEVINIIMSIHEEGYYVWLATRPHLKYSLEGTFGILSISLKPFDVNDQEHFLKAYFANRNLYLVSNPWLENKTTLFIKQLLQAARRNLFDRDHQFTGIPLQTELLADFFYPKLADFAYSKRTDSENVNFDETFDLSKLYQNFIDKKFNILCDRFRDRMADLHVCREDYPLFALKLVFRIEEIEKIRIFQDLENNYKDNPQRMELLQLDGIIVVDEQQNVSCIHRTFAEFLAAKWLATNLKNKDEQIRRLIFNLVQQRFTDGYQFLFNIFDRFVAKDCPLHLAIISGQMDEAAELMNTAPCPIRDLDEGGRSALHMIALYGHQFPLPFDLLKTHLLKEISIPNFVEELIDVLYPGVGLDSIGYSPLDYALASRSLLIAQKFCDKSREMKIKVNFNLRFKGDYLKYCIELQYKSLFEVLLQYFSFRSMVLKHISYDMNIKQYLQQSICPRDYICHPPVLNFIEEFEAMTALQFINKYDKPKNDFLFAITLLKDDRLILPEDFVINQVDVDDNSLFHYAVLHGKLLLVRLLLKKGVQIDVQNNDGNTPLHLAFIECHTAIIKLLLSEGASTNIPNKQGDTVLHLAVRSNDRGFFARHLFNAAPIRTIKLLHAHDSNLNAQNTYGETPLHVAVLKGCCMTSAELLLSGADLNKRDMRGNSPLHLAIISKNTSLANLLLCGTDVNLQNSKGETILHVAASNGCHSISAKALAKGADINKKDHFGNTPLHLALKEGQEAVASLLLHKNSNANHANADGWTPLHFAVEKGLYGCILQLFERPICVNKQNHDGNTPLHLVINKNIVDVLLSYGADINLRNLNGETALHGSARNGNAEIVSHLISKGGNINIQNLQGNTPLHLTLKTEQTAAKKMRLSIDEVSNAVWSGWWHTITNTFLGMFSSEQEHKMNSELDLTSTDDYVETAKLLVSNSSDVNIVDENGKSALHYAVEGSYGDIILELLEKGADINMQDDHGDTALHLAFKKGYRNIAELLMKNGADENIQNKKGITANEYFKYRSLSALLLRGRRVLRSKRQQTM